MNYTKSTNRSEEVYFSIFYYISRTYCYLFIRLSLFCMITSISMLYANIHLDSFISVIIIFQNILHIIIYIKIRVFNYFNYFFINFKNLIKLVIVIILFSIYTYTYIHIYIHICNHENIVSSLLSPQWVCGSTCTWAHYLRLHFAGPHKPNSAQQAKYGA